MTVADLDEAMKPLEESESPADILLAAREAIKAAYDQGYEDGRYYALKDN